LGESLSKGKVNYLGEVVCPWHSYRYDLSTGEECAGRGVPARCYPLEIRENGLWIGLEIG
jgi:nitrite reductase/ring-hydroxylating ferredoxin subunit